MRKLFFVLHLNIIFLFLYSCNTTKLNEEKVAPPRLFQKLENNVNLASGTIERYYFTSINVDTRNIDIWLPDGYSKGRKYNVLYMHDAQMLYDKGNSWNASEWEVDETITNLLSKGEIKDVIVVGIWNNGHKRHLEFFPQKSIDSIASPQREILLGLMPEEPQADLYLKFLVEELKPFIDATYSVYTKAENTFIAGSSMGGLISLYAICEYPDIFGGAACISTHWYGTYEANELIPKGIQSYMKKHLPDPKNHKVYFDYGTVGLDAPYGTYQKNMDLIMKDAGYTSKNHLTKVFEGNDHSEKYWSKRFYIPIKFLLGKK